MAWVVAPEQVIRKLVHTKQAADLHTATFNQMALLYLDQAADNPQLLDLAVVVCRQAQQINRDYAPIYNTWGLIAADAAAWAKRVETDTASKVHVLKPGESFNL